MLIQNSDIPACAYCRDDNAVLAYADQRENQWGANPIEIAEHECDTCGETYHWWYFLWEVPIRESVR